MRISVLGINFYSDLTGILVYTREMCEYLKEEGYDVTVYTGFPYYPQWKIEEK